MYAFSTFQQPHCEEKLHHRVTLMWNHDFHCMSDSVPLVHSINMGHPFFFYMLWKSFLPSASALPHLHTGLSTYCLRWLIPRQFSRNLRAFNTLVYNFTLAKISPIRLILYSNKIYYLNLPSPSTTIQSHCIVICSCWICRYTELFYIRKEYFYTKDVRMFSRLKKCLTNMNQYENAWIKSSAFKPLSRLHVSQTERIIKAKPHIISFISSYPWLPLSNLLPQFDQHQVRSPPKSSVLGAVW